VAFFGTGGGDTNPHGRDGLFAGVGAPLGQLLGQVTATIDGETAEVIYAGPAPGALEGVLQVNLKIPATARDGNLEVIITIAGRPSQPGVTVAVRRR
jgi:uncharacterized protein (TIGR03437 family)